MYFVVEIRIAIEELHLQTIKLSTGEIGLRGGKDDDANHGKAQFGGGGEFAGQCEIK